MLRHNNTKRMVVVVITRTAVKTALQIRVRASLNIKDSVLSRMGLGAAPRKWGLEQHMAGDGIEECMGVGQ